MDGMNEMKNLLKEIAWRVEDTRAQLISEGVRGTSMYNCDEWSTPAINLQLVLNMIEEATGEKV